MRKLLLIALSLVFAVGVLATACGSGGTTDTTVTTTVSSSDTTAALTETTAATTSETTQVSSDVIKIGHIRPRTGVMAMTSERMMNAFNFALEQAGYQVAGKTIEIIEGDSKGDAATAVEVARKMVELDKVVMIVGPTQGGEEMAVASYCEQVGIPFMFTNPAPFGIVAQGMKWAVLAGGTEPQLASAMGVYAYEQAGYKNVDVLTGDFAPGHGFLDAFMTTFKSKGGTIAQETYTPYPSQDFSSQLTVLKDADAVVAWIDGEQAIKLLTQYHELGIDKKMPIVGAFHGSFLAPFILSALPAEASAALIGAITPTPYSPLLDTEFNKQFVADFQAKFGSLPEDTDSGPYEGVMIILAALEATNGDTTPQTLRDALVAVTLDGPQGPVKFDPVTGATIKTIYIGKVAKQGEAFVWDPIFSYPDVPAQGL
jgi:branched-chain amino acid transport system substrate-binding protein